MCVRERSIKGHRGINGPPLSMIPPKCLFNVAWFTSLGEGGRQVGGEQLRRLDWGEQDFSLEQRKSGEIVERAGRRTETSSER
jgi:hypothetical protein